MLAARETAKTTVGARRVKPSERPSAVAQAASRTPEMMRTSQYTMVSQDAVLSLSGYGALVREPCLRPTSTFSHRAPTGR